MSWKRRKSATEFKARVAFEALHSGQTLIDSNFGLLDMIATYREVS